MLGTLKVPPNARVLVEPPSLAVPAVTLFEWFIVLPVLDSPVPAVICPAPVNCTKVTAVVSSVPLASTLHK